MNICWLDYNLNIACLDYYSWQLCLQKSQLVRVTSHPHRARLQLYLTHNWCDLTWPSLEYYLWQLYQQMIATSLVNYLTWLSLDLTITWLKYHLNNICDSSASRYYHLWGSSHSHSKQYCKRTWLLLDLTLTWLDYHFTITCGNYGRICH